MTTAHKARIEWIDIAKAIAIILMIVGHTFPYGAYVRNVIFSFHMPLFLILSGYTFRFSNSWKEIGKKTGNDFRQLILPVFLIMIIGTIYNLLKNGCTCAYFLDITRRNIDELIWASGINVHSAPALGAPWFLISLFWARLTMRVIGIKLPHDYAILTGLGCGSVAILAGTHLELPQNYDVTLMAIMFMTIGILAREHAEKVRQYKIPLFIVSLLIWLTCLNKGIYIELASRSYPYGMISVIEAVCGSFVCCIFARICTFCKHKKLMNLLGRNTIILLEIHCVDSIWAFVFQGGNSLGIVSVKRVIADVLILLIVISVKSGAGRIKQHITPVKTSVNV